MIAPRTVLRRSPRALYRDLAEGEGGVLLHLDTAAYHGINAVGALVWSMLDGVTFSALLEKLRSELQGVPPTFEHEIGEFVENLAARDLVVLEFDAGGDDQ